MSVSCQHPHEIVYTPKGKSFFICFSTCLLTFQTQTVKECRLCFKAKRAICHFFIRFVSREQASRMKGGGNSRFWEYFWKLYKETVLECESPLVHELQSSMYKNPVQKPPGAAIGHAILKVLTCTIPIDIDLHESSLLLHLSPLRATWISLNTLLFSWVIWERSHFWLVCTMYIFCTENIGGNVDEMQNFSWLAGLGNKSHKIVQKLWQ